MSNPEYRMSNRAVTSKTANRKSNVANQLLSLLSVIAIAVAWWLLLAGVDPVPTWFYVFAWYPTLVLLDVHTSKRFGQSPILSRPHVILPMLAWSAVIWLLFEAANFRLQNWYYVFLPANPIARWAGILLSFATVVPAVLLGARLFDSAWSGPHSRRRMTMSPGQLRAAEATGVAAGVLALAVPHLFFPLIWGAVWLAVDPWLYRRRPDWSLLGDLERGDWSRVTRLLAGGAMIGLLWEFYNYWARGKWIYTVPWLEELKLFEMPPFGFVGFPIFALEAWTLYHALCALGLATPVDVVSKTDRDATTRVHGATSLRRVSAAALAIVFTVATLLGMERLTNSSTAPTIEQVATISETAVLAESGFDSPYHIEELTADDLVRETNVTINEATRIVELVDLMLLKGLGAVHAERLVELGIASVCALSETDPFTIWSRLDAQGHVRPTQAEARVWVRAAERRCGN